MTFSCDDALSEIRSEYESMPLKTRSGKTVQLRNLLLLGDEGLKSATVILNALQQSDDSDGGIDKLTILLPKMRDLLLLIADKPADLKAEMKDWPLGMYMRVTNAWQEVTELGEASDSDS